MVDWVSSAPPSDESSNPIDLFHLFPSQLGTPGSSGSYILSGHLLPPLLEINGGWKPNGCFRLAIAPGDSPHLPPTSARAHTRAAACAAKSDRIRGFHPRSTRQSVQIWRGETTNITNPPVSFCKPPRITLPGKGCQHRVVGVRGRLGSFRMLGGEALKPFHLGRVEALAFWGMTS